MTPNPASCVFTIDVEDWFHILDVPSTPPLSAWQDLPSRVERNHLRLLDLLSQSQARATCFFLGWIAERFPHLVRETVQRGHEVASHGYSHRLAYEMTQSEFRDDVRRSRRLLEDIGGEPVIGSRTPGFSATSKTAWFFDELEEAGYRYDSSVFPARRGHGGAPGARMEPHRVAGGSLVEFPVTVADLGLARICFSGGGYLRLLPYAVVRYLSRAVLASGRPVIYYIHPREIDPAHSRLPMSFQRRFKTYVNLRSTERKLRALLADFPATTFRDLLSEFESKGESRERKAVAAVAASPKQYRA